MTYIYVIRRLKVNITLPSTPGSPKWSISLRLSPPKSCIHFPSHPYSLHAPPIPFFSILSPKQYLVSSTNRKAPRYVVFSTPVLSRPSQAQILTSTPYSQTPSAYVHPSVSDQVSHPYRTTGNIIVLYILIFNFLDSKLEDKRFCTE